MTVEPVTRVCVQCGKQFVMQPCYGSRTKSCSRECWKLHRRAGAVSSTVTLKCVGCGMDFNVSYKLRRQKYCDRSCASRKSWNKGLTMNDQKLRATIEKANETKARLVAEGKLRWKTSGKGTFHVSGKLVGERTYCRSTYELAYCRQLDADENVISYEVEPLALRYEHAGTTHRYYPDFLVNHDDGLKSLVEVKPVRLLATPMNMAKFRAAREWCEENGASFQVVTEKELEISLLPV